MPAPPRAAGRVQRGAVLEGGTGRGGGLLRILRILRLLRVLHHVLHAAAARRAGRRRADPADAPAPAAARVPAALAAPALPRRPRPHSVASRAATRLPPRAVASEDLRPTHEPPARRRAPPPPLRAGLCRYRTRSLRLKPCRRWRWRACDARPRRPRIGCTEPPPPSLPYKVDTSRPSLRTNWTRPPPPPHSAASASARCLRLEGARLPRPAAPRVPRGPPDLRTTAADPPPPLPPVLTGHVSSLLPY